MPSYRMSGLTGEQLDELVARAEDFLEEPWDKDTGRPKALSLRDALIVACGYMRNNITEEVWAEIFKVSQSCISRYLKLLTPVIADTMEDERPTAEDAAEATRGAIALVDGTLWPCWSWAGAKDLWAGKYKTTGHGSPMPLNMTLTAIALDCPDPRALAAFYQQATGLELHPGSDDDIAGLTRMTANIGPAAEPAAARYA